MAVEAIKALKSYPEGSIYFPTWRKVYSAEFSRILSHAKLDSRKCSFKELENLGFKVERDQSSQELLRILPTTSETPQLIFRIEEEGLRLLSGNQERSGRDWVRSISVELERGQSLNLRLGDAEDSLEGVSYFKLERTYVPQVNGDAGYVNTVWGPGFFVEQLTG